MRLVAIFCQWAKLGILGSGGVGRGRKGPGGAEGEV